MMSLKPKRAVGAHVGQRCSERNPQEKSARILFPDLAELPLVTLDFSCNKVSTIPVCYRKMKHLQSLQLDNNPLQSPPAQVFRHLSSFLSVCVCLLLFFSFLFRYVLRAKFTYSSIWPWRRVGLRSCLCLSTCLWWSVCLNPPLAGLFLNTHSPSPVYKSAKLVFYHVLNINRVAGTVRFEPLPLSLTFFDPVWINRGSRTVIRVWAVTMEIRDSPLLRYRWPVPHLLAYTRLLFLLLFFCICSHQMKKVPACQGLITLGRMESEKQVPAAHLSHTALSIYFSYSRIILGRPGFIYFLPMVIRKSISFCKKIFERLMA